LLWADGIGGYLVCLDNRSSWDGPARTAAPTSPCWATSRAVHATVLRDGDGYILQAEQPTFVNGRRVETAPLRDGDVIRLGPTLELEFRQPSPISSTARLRILSRHRLPVAVDGVILMAETCIVGSSPQAHIPAAGLDHPVVLYRQGAALVVPGPRRIRDRRPALPGPGPPDLAVERPRRGILLQPGAVRAPDVAGMTARRLIKCRPRRNA
jgi:hypothetical protein